MKTMRSRMDGVEFELTPINLGTSDFEDATVCTLHYQHRSFSNDGEPTGPTVTACPVGYT